MKFFFSAFLLFFSLNLNAACPDLNGPYYQVGGNKIRKIKMYKDTSELLVLSDNGGAPAIIDGNLHVIVSEYGLTYKAICNVNSVSIHMYLGISELSTLNYILEEKKLIISTSGLTNTSTVFFKN